jgi:phage-related protein
LKYISEAKSFIHSGIKFDEIHKNDNFKSFRSMNKICIHDAQIVDILLNKTAGTRWLSAYHYLPDENKLNVGLLTFNLE